MILYRYLMGALARGYLLVAAALLALFGLFDFMEQADDVGEASFGTADALAVVAMSLPARLLDLSPFIALLGAVYGLSTFVRSHELIAMRAAAVTPLRLAVLAGLATAGFFVVLAGVELIARPLSQEARMLHMTETSQDGTLFSSEGIWIEHGGLFVNIESLARGGAPTGVRLYDFGNDTMLDHYLEADHAELRDRQTWTLIEVTAKDYLSDGGIETRRLESLAWSPPWRQTTALYELPLESLSLPELSAHRRYLTEEGRPTGIYAMEFWRRLLMPASGIVFTLFGAPFVLGVGPRSSMGGAVSLGVANALVMFLVQQIGTNLLFLATGSPLLAVGLPILAVLAVAAALIRRINGAPR